MNRQEIIEEQISLVHRVVDAFVAKNPYFSSVKDDLFQEGVLKVINIVDKFIKENKEFDASFRNYVRISLVSAGSDFIRNNSVIRAPKDVWVHCHPLSPYPTTENHPYVDETQYRDDWEIITDITEHAKDALDYAIIGAKLGGAKNAEKVAELTNISIATVYRRLSAIKRRYDKHKRSDTS